MLNFQPFEPIQLYLGQWNQFSVEAAILIAYFEIILNNIKMQLGP